MIGDYLVHSFPGLAIPTIGLDVFWGCTRLFGFLFRVDRIALTSGILSFFLGLVSVSFDIFATFWHALTYKRLENWWISEFLVFRTTVSDFFWKSLKDHWLWVTATNVFIRGCISYRNPYSSLKGSKVTISANCANKAFCLAFLSWGQTIIPRAGDAPNECSSPSSTSQRAHLLSSQAQ